jgi:hypothetical protein
LPALGRIFGEGGIQPDRRVHDAQAVRANQAHGTAPQLLLNLMFKCSAFRAALLEPSRNHHRGPGAGIRALSSELRDRHRRGVNYS